MVLIIFIILIISSCVLPHDPFRINRPEELTTICHIETRKDGFGEYPLLRVQSNELNIIKHTIMFNTSRAKQHINEHSLDYFGKCN